MCIIMYMHELAADLLQRKHHLGLQLLTFKKTFPVHMLYRNFISSSKISKIYKYIIYSCPQRNQEKMKIQGGSFLRRTSRAARIACMTCCTEISPARQKYTGIKYNQEKMNKIRRFLRNNKGH